MYEWMNKVVCCCCCCCCIWPYSDLIHVLLIWSSYFSRLWPDTCLLVAGVGAGRGSDFLLAQCWVWRAYHLWKLQQISQQLWKVSKLIFIFEYTSQNTASRPPLSFRTISRSITLVHQLAHVSLQIKPCYLVLSWNSSCNLLKLLQKELGVV